MQNSNSKHVHREFLKIEMTTSIWAKTSHVTLHSFDSKYSAMIWYTFNAQMLK